MWGRKSFKEILLTFLTALLEANYITMLLGRYELKKVHIACCYKRTEPL